MSKNNLFINNKVKLSQILFTGGLVVAAGFGGYGISKLSTEFSQDKDGSKENSNSETTTIIETTEKTYDTEDTVTTTIETIMSDFISEKSSTVTSTPEVEEKEEIATTTVAETEPVVTTTKEEITTTAPIVTTVAQETKAPVVTTVQETTVKQVPVAETSIKVGMTEQDFDDMSQALINEINSKVTINGKRISKTNNQMFDLSDVYTIVYCINQDAMDDELKQTLMNKYPVLRTFESSIVDSYDVIDPVGTDFKSKLVLNTQIDEFKFACDYFSDDPNVYWTDFKNADYFGNDPNRPSTLVTTRLSNISDEEYFEQRRYYYYENENSDWFKGSNKISVGSLDGFNQFDRGDIVNFGVAFYDKNAAKNMDVLIDMIFDASNDNSKNYETLQNIYNFCNHNSNSTSVEHCGAGFEYAANVYIEAFRSYIFENPFRTGRSNAYDESEWSKMKRMNSYIQESVSDLSNLNRLYNKCPYVKENTKQLTK